MRDAEQARAHGLRLSRDQTKHITDCPVRVWADAASRTVLLVRKSASNQGERHEIAHVLSHTFWGPSLDWLGMGKTPAAVDGEWRTHLKASYADPRIDWALSKKEGCQ